jgi:hypothetical protein
MRDDLAALLWIAANLSQVVQCLRMLVEMHRCGGSLVCVPPQASLISTLAQFDGDFVTFVDPRTFTEGYSPDALPDLIAQHAEALQMHLAVMSETFATRIAGCARALRDIAVVGWIALEALGGSAQRGDWHLLAGNLAGLGWATLQPLLLWQTVAIGVPVLLHFGVPRLLRTVLRRGWLH